MWCIAEALRSHLDPVHTGWRPWSRQRAGQLTRCPVSLKRGVPYFVDPCCHRVLDLHYQMSGFRYAWVEQQ